MNDDLTPQDASDEVAAHDFMARSVMCAEVTLTGATARSIARYISNLEVESDNDLAGVQSLVKQNNILRNALKRVYEMCNGLPMRQYVADFVSKNWPSVGDAASPPNAKDQGSDK
jgi:hypothetical protein